MQNYTALLVPETTYHIYNRANGNEKLFREPENYLFFLKKYQEHVSPVMDTFCYCLMPNHFHFLVRTKPEEALRQAFPKFETLERLLSKRLSNFFSSYTQAFNKQQNRMGSLFMKNFKRKIISDANYLNNIIRYIHLNPVHANLCINPEEWPHSSYSEILSDNQTFLMKEELISWFNDLENFKLFHKEPDQIY
jgi:putative transposase